MRLRPEQFVSRFERILRRRALLAGLAQALSRFSMLLGVLLLVAWSYSIWGSEVSPLGALLVPAVVLMVLSILIRLVLGWVLRWIRRAVAIDRRRRRIQQRVRFSKMSVKKL